MKTYVFWLTDYAVANLFNAVDAFLEELEDTREPRPSKVQYQTLVSLFNLFEERAMEYFDCETSSSIPWIFDPKDVVEGGTVE